jgi:hypothetical protein
VTRLAVSIIDQLFLVVLGDVSPTDDEWERFAELVAQQGSGMKTLARSNGGEPTRAQGRRLSLALANYAMPAAVLSPSARVRRTVCMLSQLNRQVAAFAPSELAEALRYLRLPDRRIGLIRGELAVLVEMVASRSGRDRVAKEEP